LNTKYSVTVKELQRQVYKLYKEQKGYKWFSFNSFGLGAFEADMLAIHPTENFCVEFEIKRSKADFMKDFQKKNKHELLKAGKYVANQFYFVCERGILKAEDIPHHLGLITVEKQITNIDYKKNGIIRRKKQFRYDIAIVKKAKVLHKKPFPDHLMIKILTSVMNKYLNEHLDKNYWRGVFENKKATVLDISARNQVNNQPLPCIFTDEEIMAEYRKEIFGTGGYPKFIYKDENQEFSQSYLDHLNYYSKGADVTCSYFGEVKLGKVKFHQPNSKTVTVTFGDNSDGIELSITDVTRIL